MKKSKQWQRLTAATLCAFMLISPLSSTALAATTDKASGTQDTSSLDLTSEPTKSEAPVEPAEPEAPVEPAGPEAPVEPVEPEAPVEPAEPEAPVEPAAPEVPAEPVAPKEIIEFDYPAEVMAMSREFQLEEMLMQLPKTVDVYLADGTKETVSARWICEEDDAIAYSRNPLGIHLLAFRMTLPDGYVLSKDRADCDLPKIIGALDLQISSNVDDRMEKSYTRLYSDKFGKNLIVDSSGKKFGTRYHHWFAGGDLAYCFGAGKANPRGEYDYQFVGYASPQVAAIVDNGYPNTTNIGGHNLTAEQAQQATQAAVWCFSNDYNKYPVSIDGLRASAGVAGANETYAAARWLATTAAAQGSNSLYAIYQTVDQHSGYQEMLGVYNYYTPTPNPEPLTTGTIRIQKRSSDPSITDGNPNYSLAGGQFGIYEPNGRTVTIITTDASGRGEATVPVGEYYVQELVAPPGYKLSDEKHNVVVSDHYSQGASGCTLNWYYNGVLNMVQGGNYSGYTAVAFAVWKNSDQSDLVWYSGAKINDTAWNATANITQPGRYNVHVYGTDSNGRYLLSTQTIDLDMKGCVVEVDLENPPALGQIEIQKTSSNPDLTENNPMFSLEGAEYSIFSDSACTNLVATITTDANGHGISKLLTIGTYYVKETKAPAGYKLDTKVYPVQLNQQKIQTFENSLGHGKLIWNTRGLLRLEYHTNNPYTSMRFAVWQEANQSDLWWYNATALNSTTWEGNAYRAWHSGDGVYTIHVYGTDGSGEHLMNGLWMDLTTKNQVVTLPVQDEPNAGKIMLQKASSMPDITDGNSCYSLEGAEYGVYHDESCTDLVTTMITDAEGKAEAIVEPAKYYIREIKAPAGYELDETVYPVTVRNGATIYVNFKDMPGNDPIGITLTKIQETPNPYIPSMAGAEFTVNYYDGQYATTAELPEQPTRTWVIQTLVRTKPDGSTEYMTRLDDRYKVRGDSFYYGPSGSPIVPIGTVSIQETKAPEGYILSGGFMNDHTGSNLADENGVVLLHVTQDGIDGNGYLEGGNYYTQKESFDLTHNLTLRKFDDAHTLLPGISFTLQIKNPETGNFDDLNTGVTDDNGEIRFESLVFGTYRLVETQTNEDLSLLPEPIEFEINSDTDPELEINIENPHKFELPLTGGSGLMPVLCTIGAVMLTAGCVIVFRDRKRKKSS